MTFDTIYENIKRAVTLEIKSQYINCDGKKMTFAKFMLMTLKDVFKKINKAEKENILKLINLYESYHIDGVNNRKYTIDRTLETFYRLRGLIKPKKNESAAGEETHLKKEFQSEIDEIDVTYVKGVGPEISKILNKMGIFKVKDLIEYYPRKYIDYKFQNKIKDLKIGENVSVTGIISKVNYHTTANKLTIFTVSIKDSTGILPINFFIKAKNRRILEHYKKMYPVNSTVVVYGKVKIDEYNLITTLDKAQIQILGEGVNIESQSSIVPIYPLIEGLNPKTLTRAIKNALEKYEDKIYEPIPDDIIKKAQIISKLEAIKLVHNPKTMQDVDISRKRLAFEELFFFELNLLLLRKEYSKNKSIELKTKKNGLVDKFIKNLPFELTLDQKKAMKEIMDDLNTSTPMQRLLQGDVGSGKTVVACATLLAAIENGYQGAIMAPTEILATQHYKNFSSWLTPLGLSIGLFTGKSKQKVKKELLVNLKNGQIHVAVGTHALIQEGVEFNNLGVVVIDEQHRFGVKQRNKLLNKGKMPQMLNMTATPIPRTLALTLHGDLDISTITELPKGRKPVITTLGGAKERNRIYELIKKEIFFKHQAYIVYPLIEESEAISAKAATLEKEKLEQGVFKGYKLGLLTGKMDSDEKDNVMNDFKNGKFDILVSTTVVEVGVDNPNATVIVIENAERFGLSQLHQLRGRVGRSDNQSYCALIVEKVSNAVKDKLSIMTKTNDGFIISKKDLELRGPGEFLGVRQSGIADFKLADIVNDIEMLEASRNLAQEFIENDDIGNYPELNFEVQKYSIFRG